MKLFLGFKCRNLATQVVHRITQDCSWHSCQFRFLPATLRPMGIYFWSTADSFNLCNISKSNMQNTSHIKPFTEIISQLFSSDILYLSVLICVACSRLSLCSCKENASNRSSGVIFVSSLSFCGPGGIAGHVEQHCAQVWHHTQRAGSAEQAVLQSSGAWPGVTRHARLHWYIQLQHFITAASHPQPPTNCLISY